MKIKNKFPLSHVTLYSKGWYNHSENIIFDLIKILELDNYSPFDQRDVVSIIMHRYEESFDIDMVNFINDIHPFNCWKVGYYTNRYEWVKDHQTLPEYDIYTAIIYKILSDIRFLTNTEWEIKLPKYSKENKRPENITIPRLIELSLLKTRISS